jgi:hypothetical protein
MLTVLTLRDNVFLVFYFEQAFRVIYVITMIIPAKPIEATKYATRLIQSGDDTTTV